MDRGIIPLGAQSIFNTSYDEGDEDDDMVVGLSNIKRCKAKEVNAVEGGAVLLKHLSSVSIESPARANRKILAEDPKRSNSSESSTRSVTPTDSPGQQQKNKKKDKSNKNKKSKHTDIQEPPGIEANASLIVNSTGLRGGVFNNPTGTQATSKELPTIQGQGQGHGQAQNQKGLVSMMMQPAPAGITTACGASSCSSSGLCTPVTPVIRDPKGARSGIRDSVCSVDTTNSADSAGSHRSESIQGGARSGAYTVTSQSAFHEDRIDLAAYRKSRNSLPASIFSSSGGGGGGGSGMGSNPPKLSLLRPAQREDNENDNILDSLVASAGKRYPQAIGSRDTSHHGGPSNNASAHGGPSNNASHHGGQSNNNSYHGSHQGSHHGTSFASDDIKISPRRNTNIPNTRELLSPQPRMGSPRFTASPSPSPATNMLVVSAAALVRLNQDDNENDSILDTHFTVRASAPVTPTPTPVLGVTGNASATVKGRSATPDSSQIKSVSKTSLARTSSHPNALLNALTTSASASVTVGSSPNAGHLPSSASYGGRMEDTVSTPSTPMSNAGIATPGSSASGGGKVNKRPTAQGICREPSPAPSAAFANAMTPPLSSSSSSSPAPQPMAGIATATGFHPSPPMPGQVAGAHRGGFVPQRPPQPPPSSMTGVMPVTAPATGASSSSSSSSGGAAFHKSPSKENDDVHHFSTMSATSSVTVPSTSTGTANASEAPTPRTTSPRAQKDSAGMRKNNSGFGSHLHELDNLAQAASTSTSASGTRAAVRASPSTMFASSGTGAIVSMGAVECDTRFDDELSKSIHSTWDDPEKKLKMMREELQIARRWIATLEAQVVQMRGDGHGQGQGQGLSNLSGHGAGAGGVPALGGLAIQTVSYGSDIQRSAANEGVEEGWEVVTRKPRRCNSKGSSEKTSQCVSPDELTEAIQEGCFRGQEIADPSQVTEYQIIGEQRRIMKEQKKTIEELRALLNDRRK